MSSDSSKKFVSVLVKNLGVSKSEAQVLLPIYLGGNMTAGAIALLSGLALTKVERICKKLVKRNLVTRIDGVVPIYRALPPSLALADALTELVNKLQDLSSKTGGSFNESLSTIDTTVDEVIRSRKSYASTVRERYAAYEAKVIETVQTHINSMIKLTSTAIVKFLEHAESKMKNVESHLEINLGEELTALQNDLDEVQKELNESLESIVSEFEATLTSEKEFSSNLIGEFGKQVEELIEAAVISVSDVATETQKRIEKNLKQITEGLRADAAETAEQSHSVLISASDELKQVLTHLESDLSRTYIEIRDSLASLIAQARESNESHAELTRSRIESLAQAAGTMTDNIDGWAKEANSFIDSAVGSITNHLRQISSMDDTYTSGIENILSSYFEKSAVLLGGEYNGFRELVTETRNDFESFIGSTRASVMELLQTQNELEMQQWEQARLSLVKDLDRSLKRTRTSMKKQVSQTVDEISTMLETEAEELRTLVSNMDSRLCSAINSAISSASSRNEKVLTGAHKFVDEFKSSFGVQLNEILNRFSTEIADQVEATKVLYEDLNTRLNERLADSISTVNAHVAQVESDIENTIEAQVGRMDRHAKGIRQEFHTHMEDITRQFLSLVQSIETTFNGFLANQTMEVRDLVKSTHLTFKETIQQEMNALQEASLKLQQEYTSEIGQKLDKVVESAAVARKTLEDLTNEKREQITEGLRETLARLGAALTSIESSLKEIESSTITQMSESLVQLTQEFKASIDSARNTITKLLDNVQDTLLHALQKGVNTAKRAAESFTAEQADLRQRELASTSKKIDAFAIDLGKSVSDRFDKYLSFLSERESESVKVHNQVRDETISAISERRAEAIESLNSAAAWVDSAMHNISTSLNNLESKLANEITVIQQTLAKASAEIADEVLSKGAENIVQLDEMASGFVKRVESLFKNHTLDFSQNVSEQIERSAAEIAELQKNIENIVTITQSKMISSTNQIREKVQKRVNQTSKALRSTSNSIITGYNASVERVHTRLEKSRDDLFEAVRAALMGATTRTASRFEATGLNLKTRLSRDVYSFIESVRTEMTAQAQQVQADGARVSNTITEDASQLKQQRNEAVDQLEAEFDRLLRSWQSNVKQKMHDLRNTIDKSIKNLSDTAEQSTETVRAIRNASDLLLASTVENTWYLTGHDELCAHILDMAKRAQNSILISVTDVSSLNLKKLAKIKTPIRKVLVVPRIEETEQPFEAPAGWRVWEIDAPPYLSVRDDEEIVIGGIPGKENPFAIVSTDQSFLRLYHDVLGPRLVRRRAPRA